MVARRRDRSARSRPGETPMPGARAARRCTSGLRDGERSGSSHSFRARPADRIELESELGRTDPRRGRQFPTTSRARAPGQALPRGMRGQIKKPRRTPPRRLVSLRNRVAGGAPHTHARHENDLSASDLSCADKSTSQLAHALANVTAAAATEGGAGAHLGHRRGLRSGRGGAGGRGSCPPAGGSYSYASWGRCSSRCTRPVSSPDDVAARSAPMSLPASPFPSAHECSRFRRAP